MVEHNKYRGITEGATHYHADYVSPKWAPELDLVGSIGMHIFYRWP
jgi:spore germination cell wall hydrolase CwlJ-like protein